MGALVERDLDWVGRAPVSVTGRAGTSASPEQVFAVLADHERSLTKNLDRAMRSLARRAEQGA